MCLLYKTAYFHKSVIILQYFQKYYVIGYT
jgi:hypothetical protein